MPTAAGLARAIEMAEDWRAGGWYELTGAMLSGHLAGRWIHPDICFEFDQKLLGEGMANIPICCRDRADPVAPRRFDPAGRGWSMNTQTWARDLGVTNFSILSAAAQDWTADGVPFDVQASLLTWGSLVGAGIHESFEMYQDSPGHPVLDPHDEPDLVVRTVVTAGGRRFVVPTPV
ncbi:MAG: hypothetical protein ACRD0J_01860 [Acidimicrobiales bacterium]